MDAEQNPEARAFLQAIIENPGDDAPRLIFADWLEEHDTGDGKQVARAEFIRIQCTLAQMSANDPNYPKLKGREQMLFKQHRRDWEQPLHDIVPDCFDISFVRGFPETANLAVDDFLEHVSDLFATAPLRRIQLGCFDRMEPDKRNNQVCRLAACPHLQQLTALDLHGNTITNVGAQALSASPHLKHLTHLDLSSTAVCNDGALALVNSPYLKNLTYLNLGNNAIGRALLNQIKRTMEGRYPAPLRTGITKPTPPLAS